MLDDTEEWRIQNRPEEFLLANYAAMCKKVCSLSLSLSLARSLSFTLFLFLSLARFVPLSLSLSCKEVKGKLRVIHIVRST